MRVAILNGAAGRRPMMARDRHEPIVDAIERGDVAAAVAVVEEHMAAAADHFAQSAQTD